MVRGTGRGNPILEPLRHVAGMAVMAWRVLGAVASRRSSLPVATVMDLHLLPRALYVPLATFFMGASVVWLLGAQVHRLGFSLATVAGPAVRISFHAVVPVFGALFFSVAVLGPVAGWLATLARAGVVDALEAVDEDPAGVLAGPLVAATFITMPLVIALSELSFLAGMALSAVSVGESWWTVLDFSSLRAVDGWIVLAKALSFGAVAAIPPAYTGMKEDVPGRAAALGAMGAMMACGTLDLMWGVLHVMVAQ